MKDFMKDFGVRSTAISFVVVLLIVGLVLFSKNRPTEIDEVSSEALSISDKNESTKASVPLEKQSLVPVSKNSAEESLDFSVKDVLDAEKSLKDFLIKYKKKKITNEQIRKYIQLIGEIKKSPQGSYHNLTIKSVEDDIGKYLSDKDIVEILRYSADRNEFMVNYLNQNQMTFVIVLELVNFKNRLLLIREKLNPTDISNPDISILLDKIKKQSMALLSSRVSLVKQAILKDKDEIIRSLDNRDLSAFERESEYQQVAFSKKMLFEEINKQFTETAGMSSCLQHYTCTESCQSYDECVAQGKISTAVIVDVDSMLIQKKPQPEIFIRLEKIFLSISELVEKIF